MRFNPSLPFRRTLVGLLASGFTVLTGCGYVATPVVSSPAASLGSAFGGKLIGGENPVTGASISIYETASTGVAYNGVYTPGSYSGSTFTAGTPLAPIATTLSDSGGNFNFTSAVACSNSNDFVYAVAAGGNTGAGLNANTLLTSVIGPCSTLASSTFVIINELSTIAAAYTLSGFTTVSGAYTTASGSTSTASSYSVTSGVATIVASNSLVSGQPVKLSGFTTSPATAFNGNTYTVVSATSSQFTFSTSAATTVSTNDAGTITPTVVSTLPSVSIVSDATNYAGTAGIGTPTNAAGLAHAFLNAANFINLGSSTVNTAIPGNSGTIVPVALMNALGNSAQACVNTTGGAASSSTVNDGTNCGKLFMYTATPTGTVPTNTLQALLNLAHNPTTLPTAANVANIFNLGSAFAPFAPAISAHPNDWSLAIAYEKYDGVTNGNHYVGDTTVCSSITVTPYTNGLCYPYSLTLDADDNVYVANSDASSEAMSNVLAFSSKGSVLWTTAVDSTTYKFPTWIAADGLGNVFLLNNGTSSASTNSVVEYDAANGNLAQAISTVATSPYSIAVDSSNNLWVGIAAASGSQNVYELTCGSPCGTASTYTSATFGATPTGGSNAQYPYQVAIDPSLNLWASNYKSGVLGVPWVLPYTAPQVGPPVVNAYDASVVTASPAIGSTGLTNYGVAIDSSGNGWVTTASNIFKLTATGSGSSFATSAGSAIPYTASGGTASLRFANFDGNNTLWTVDNNTTNSAVVGYSTTAATPTVFLLKPCIANTTTCPSVATTGVEGPRVAQVDSTGSIWVASSTNGNIVQIFGAAAPTWPLLGDLKPGILP